MLSESSTHSKKEVVMSTPSHGVQLALLEGRLLSGEIDCAFFVEQASRLGLARQDAVQGADKLIAIAANQAVRSKALKRSYDYIVVGAGASGSVVARRLADDSRAHVLLLEAGGDDLKPNVLVTEGWFMNIGGEMDWSFAAEPTASVNGRSIHQAMGKGLGGGTSINGLVWARGHRHDFERWGSEAGDDAWGYAHVLDIYKRIEDWQGPPDPARRGQGGEVYVQPVADPSPLAPAFLEALEGMGIPTFPDQNGLLEEAGEGGALTN